MLKDKLRPSFKVYGPYVRRQDGRSHVVLYDGVTYRTISYPKWLMEQHLGRELDPDEETVDHKDRDFTNNALSNLQVISRSRHVALDVWRVRLVTITCVECGETATRKPSQLARNSRTGKAGPFCGKVCAGRYGARVQNGGKKLPAQSSKIKKKYYRNSKVL